MSSQLDAISYAQQLEAAGVPKNQAEVHARILADVLSKLVEFPRDLATFESRLEAKIDACEARMINRIELTEARLLSRIEAGEARMLSRIEAGEAKMLSRIEAGEARLFSRIESGEAKLWGEITLLKWMTGTSIALNIAVLLKLFIR